MRIELWCIGKSKEVYIKSGIAEFSKRIQHFAPFEMIILPDIKSSAKWSAQQFKTAEGEKILARLQKTDTAILLDANGKSFSSEHFARFMEQKLSHSGKRLIFIIGGAYGFSQAVYDRIPHRLSLSEMTFSHQLIRLIFLEQLYRAFTILRNLPYHNG